MLLPVGLLLAVSVISAAGQDGVCPSGWLDGEEFECFLFLLDATGLSWIEAEQRCEREGGYLAEPTNDRKADFLHGAGIIFGAVSGIKNWWIGLSDLGNEGHWIWTASGNNMDESFWGPNSPNTADSNTDDCALMVVESDSFWWEDTNCLTNQAQVAPICERERDQSGTTESPATTTSSTSTTSSTTTPGQCNSGWISHGGHCYALVQSFHNWQDAENDCQQRGAHLVSIHSWDEQQFINGFPGLGLSTWIGGTDKYSEGNWQWADGSSIDFYDWGLGEPNGGILENCMFLLGGKWHDGGCGSALHYICKI